MKHLAPFFKGPEGVSENDFFKQTAVLDAYIASLHRS